MQEFMRLSLDYIEQNLKAEITADELAQMANYSMWHYCRLFNEIIGSSVANYIVKRRLDYALAEISTGRKAIDVVLEYGFDTYAGFYKAFVKMYGCSPKKYLSIYKNHTSKKLEVIIMHNEKELKKILENWDIQKELTIEDISNNDWKTWKIGDEYYLKTNERSKMIRNIKIAKALKKQGLSSEFLPIPTKSGEEYLDGENIYLLTKKIGEPTNNRPLSDEEIGQLENNDIREKYAFNLGQGVAKMHKALKSVQDDIKPDENNLYKTATEWALPEVRKYNQKYNMGISEDFFNDYIENFGKLYEKLPKQLIHRNPTGDSFVYENGEVTCIKGFELFNEYNVRLFDILWCAGEINARPSFDLYLSTLKEIIKGYDSINPLTEEEKQSVYYVSAATYLIDVAYWGGETLDISGRCCKALVFLSKNKNLYENIF